MKHRTTPKSNDKTNHCQTYMSFRRSPFLGCLLFCFSRTKLSSSVRETNVRASLRASSVAWQGQRSERRRGQRLGRSLGGVPQAAAPGPPAERPAGVKRRRPNGMSAWVQGVFWPPFVEKMFDSPRSEGFLFKGVANFLTKGGKKTPPPPPRLGWVGNQLCLGVRIPIISLRGC